MNIKQTEITKGERLKHVNVQLIFMVIALFTSIAEQKFFCLTEVIRSWSTNRKLRCYDPFLIQQNDCARYIRYLIMKFAKNILFKKLKLFFEEHWLSTQKQYISFHEHCCWLKTSWCILAALSDPCHSTGQKELTACETTEASAPSHWQSGRLSGDITATLSKKETLHIEITVLANIVSFSNAVLCCYGDMPHTARKKKES